MDWKKSILLILVLLSAGCNQMPQENSDKTQVIVTILPQKQFVQEIAGNRFDVTVMVPSGASPHTYEPTASQMRAVENAKVYFLLGSGLAFEDAWFSKFKQINEEMEVVNCSKGIKLREKDPHVWLSPEKAQIMVENIYSALEKQDPGNKDIYQKNKEEYLEKLQELDRNLSQRFDGKKEIMVLHPSWGYFAEEYGLEQIAIQKEGKEPTPRQLASLIEKARKKKIKTIFASPQFNTQSAEKIAQEVDAEIVYVDPLSEDYVENLRKVSNSFKDNN